MILTHGLLIRPAMRNHADKKFADVIVCTVEQKDAAWWNCVVVKGTPVYPVGGYSLAIHADDLRNGIVCEAVEQGQEAATAYGCGLDSTDAECLSPAPAPDPPPRNVRVNEATGYGSAQYD